MRICCLILACMVALPGVVDAQIQTFQTSLTDSTLPLLYVGLANTVRIEGAQEPYSVQVSHGEATRRGPGLYEVRVDTPGPVALTVRKGGKDLYTKAMAANYRPDWVLTLGNLSGSTIKATVAQVLANPRLVIGFMRPSFYRWPSFSVVRFDYLTYRGNIQLAQGTANGADFPPMMIRAIQSLRRGDKIFIDNVKAVGPDARLRSLGGFAVQVE